MSAGIILLAWGKRGYGFMAYNLALSIKHFSPNVPITMYAERGCLKELYDLSVFDAIHYIESPIADPGRFKVSIYDKLPYDNNLYLDVDTLCLQPIDEFLKSLSEGENYYSTFIHEVYDKYSPNEFPRMYWANKDVIWDHYGFDKEKLPATQSSIQFIRKCEQSKQLFQKIEAAFDKPIPINQLKHHWGGTQPDELYLNVALAQTGIAPHIGDMTMWFGDNKSKRPHVVANEYLFLSLYGNKNKIFPPFWEYYDKRIAGMALIKGGKGFMSTAVKPDKHANGGMGRNTFRRNAGQKIRHTGALRRSSQKRVVAPVVVNSLEKKAGTVFLFTSYFTTNNPKRNEELHECMIRNIQNPYIDKIVNLGSVPFDDEKVLNIPNERPTFTDFVKTVNAIGADYSIIANTDIFFDASLELIKDYLTENDCFALSRYDVDHRGIPILFEYEWSQDSWIFKGKIREPENIDFVMGKPACDNRFAYELNKIGYCVTNPSHSIVTYHLHLSNHRNYEEKDRLEGLVIPVELTKLKMKEQISIIQPGKVGDIIICLPIAKYYADQGFLVNWVCPSKYHELFDYVDYVKPNEQVVKGSKVIDLSFGLNVNSDVHKLWRRRHATLDSFVTLKYELANTPIEKLRNLEYNRNLQKEVEVFDMVYPRTDYILVHRGSDYGSPIDIDGDHVVEFTPIEGYTIFDWRKVIENATEIHCIDSSLVNFVDCLDDVSADLFYYITDKVPKKADQTILFKNWNVINKLEYANS